MIFHIEDHRRYRRCVRLFQYTFEKSTEEFQYLRKEDEITRLAMSYLGITCYGIGQQGDTPSHSCELLESHEWVIKARFEFHGLRVKIPILHHGENGYDVYFIFMGNQPRSVDLLYYQDSLFVLKGNHLAIQKVYLLYLNPEYTRKEWLNPQDLFKQTDSFLDHPEKTILKIIQPNERMIFEDLKRMKRCYQQRKIERRLSKKCFQPTDCPFLKECQPSYEREPDDSILFAKNTTLRFQWYYQGRKKLLEIPPRFKTGQLREIAQWKAIQNPPLYVDKMKMKQWLSNLQYPLIAFDMEWDRFSIPAYSGLKPMMVLPFAYSLTILEKDGCVHSRCFISEGDGREKMIASLIRQIPKKGTIVTFNMLGAEKLRLEEWMEQFPNYQKNLQKYLKRMVDLQEPFQSGYLYHQKMRGSWTLKSILSVLEPETYSGLKVHNGLEAVDTWRKWEKEEDFQRKMQLRKNLREYSLMDSMALIKIISWLMELTK